MNTLCILPTPLVKEISVFELIENNKTFGIFVRTAKGTREMILGNLVTK